MNHLINNLSLFEILGALHSAGLQDEYLALRHYINERDERDALLDQQKGAFMVLAGNYNDLSTNCKYIANFATLDEAISAYDKLRDYSWAKIEYKGRTLQVIN